MMISKGGGMVRMRARQQGKGQVIVLVVIAVLLAVGYVALDRYTEGEKNVLIAESRGMNMVQALSKFKAEGGNYPDALDKLVPKFVPAVSKCPGGEPMAYAMAGAEYTLTCQKVVFASKPYSYDSKTKAWGG
jgi:type II secretory pathway pseudopilin PulG